MRRASLPLRANADAEPASPVLPSIGKTFREQDGRKQAAPPGAPARGPASDFSRVPLLAGAGRSGASGLTLGALDDPLETAADRASSGSPRAAAAIGGADRPTRGHEAPPIVSQALSAPGRPIDAASRAAFEARFQRDFSSVRLHADDLAARSANAIGARAYAVGEHIVLGRGPAAPGLVAHELAHVVQQRGASAPWVQRQPVTPPPAAAPAPAPRKDYVFLMGADKPKTTNPFYTAAARYFHAHAPTATMKVDLRNLAELLRWIEANVKDPIGDLYIVSHGNEDGTLSFGLNSLSPEAKMTVRDLRDALHPKGGGATTLTSVASVVDATTKIHIKGCDIGRTQEMVELIDEAFGGAGEVTAPTHEQKYTVDRNLGAAARSTAHDAAIGAFEAGPNIPQVPAAPAPVDPKLKGDEQKAAQAAFNAATAARKKAQEARKTAIKAEEARLEPELSAVEERAATVDTLSGPMFQRPGTTLFTAAELQPQVDKLYAHLSEAQRKKLVHDLVAKDRGSPDDQQGQRVIKKTPFHEDASEPANVAEAKAAFSEKFKDNDFTPTAMTFTQTKAAGKTELRFRFEGQKHPPGEKPVDDVQTLPSSFSDDALIIQKGKDNIDNPGRYDWRVESKHDSKGITRRTAVAERVRAYLHHGPLDVSAHQHFSKQENASDFYATSTFQPPAPPAKPSGAP